MAHINLNLDYCAQLRNKVNEYQHYSITRTHSLKNDNAPRGWEKICAIMDRLDDTTRYLNSLELQKTPSVLAVFDFYNFMNNAATLLDCIKYLGEIYDFDFSIVDNKSSVFNQSGTDKRYFEYLRSLCSVHPIETSHQQEFNDINTKIECSPYVRWNDGLLTSRNDYDLVAIVYTNNPKSISKFIGIKLLEIFTYIENRFNLLKDIIIHIDLYYKSIIDEYRKIPLRKENEFSDYCEYLEYLKMEYSERINTGWDEHFDFFIYAMKCTFKNKINQEKLKKYQNAIKYGFTFFHRYLQELPEEDKYETTGLHKQSEKTIGDSLFWQLQERPWDENLRHYSYPFEKLLGMWMQPRYMDMANTLIEELKPFWEKYVCFEPNMRPIEISVLLTIACHFYKLEHDENYKNDIPDTEEYR